MAQTLEDIAGTLEQYEKASITQIQEAVDKTAKEIVKQTKSNSPRLTGKYAGGWGATVQDSSSHLYVKVVHNKKKAGLAHLLEHGHGGPHPAGAHPHIVQDAETEEIMTQNIEKAMESISV